LRNFVLILPVFLTLLFISCEDVILGTDPENTPENNFNILWGEFDRYYTSFVIKGINWDSLYSVYRAQITPQISEQELWHNFENLLHELNDIHVYIFGPNGKVFFSSNRPYKPEFSLPLVKYKYLNNHYKSAGEQRFTYGRMSGDSIGYIHIVDFFGESETWVKDIDRIVQELSDVRAMIIDIRDNRGGYDENFQYIGSSFTTYTMNYCQQITRNGPNHNDFTPPVFRSLMRRENTPSFTKQIVVLTNRFTGSAAEVCALFFKLLPYSKQIGDSTSGGIGAIRGFQLPNGWLYYFPVMLNLTVEGNNIENIGVPPDICVKNTEQEIRMHFDRQLEYTLQYLSKNKKTGNKPNH